jgi:hypothetical protein
MMRERACYVGKIEKNREERMVVATYMVTLNTVPTSMTNYIRSLTDEKYFTVISKIELALKRKSSRRKTVVRNVATFG